MMIEIKNTKTRICTGYTLLLFVFMVLSMCLFFVHWVYVMSLIFPLGLSMWFLRPWKTMDLLDELYSEVKNG